MAQLREGDFEFNGYEMNFINRKNKKGGGVALYIDKSINYKVVENIITTVADVMECMTTETYVAR